MSQEQQPFFYMVRLFSFILILLAILGKNRKKAEPTNPPQAQDNPQAQG
jgi:hypothetical protein